jgi:hypothetical protein
MPDTDIGPLPPPREHDARRFVRMTRRGYNVETAIRLILVRKRGHAVAPPTVADACQTRSCGPATWEP